MTKLDFSIELPANSLDLIELATSYEDFTQYLPQIKNVKILEKNDTEVITLETMIFKTLFKKEFEMKAKHTLPSKNILKTEFFSGIINGTTIFVEFVDTENGTTVNVDIDLKLDFKMKIFQPLIKKVYKEFLTGTLYKMNTIAMQET